MIATPRSGLSRSDLVLWHGASVRVGPRITSENGITFAVGEALSAQGQGHR
jgi:hypothetical protein